MFEDYVISHVSMVAQYAVLEANEKVQSISIYWVHLMTTLFLQF